MTVFFFLIYAFSTIYCVFYLWMMEKLLEESLFNYVQKRSPEFSVMAIEISIFFVLFVPVINSITLFMFMQDTIKITYNLYFEDAD